jgi:hypothetical protein
MFLSSHLNKIRAKTETYLVGIILSLIYSSKKSDSRRRGTRESLKELIKSETGHSSTVNPD